MRWSLVKPWVCSRCLLRAQARAAERVWPATACHRSKLHQQAFTGVQHTDDNLLRQVFDSQYVWNEFSKASRTKRGRGSPGLLQNIYLTTPRGFNDFALASLEKCRTVVAKILSISTKEGYKQIVKDLDRLSDLLCRIIDLSDFVRSTHPDPLFQREAAKAHTLMYEYMNTLNTTTGLNDQLKRALEDPEITSSWSEEEMKVARILQKDFAQSAIDLPAEKRHYFIELSNAIQELGSRFLDEMRPAKESIRLKSSEMRGVDPLLVKALSNKWGYVEIPSIGSAATHILRFAENEAVRKEVYLASRTAADSQISLLEKLLRARAQLANLSGFKSFASMSLADKMARTPEAVIRFLQALAADTTPFIVEERNAMQSLKKNSKRPQMYPDIKAWDQDYFRSRLAQSRGMASRLPEQLPSFFSLGTVMQGLSRLFTRLYGVRFVPVEPQAGETWTPEVRRLNVVDEHEGLIAVIYCDLFARPGKSPNPAHFTLRCSRHITAQEVAEAEQMQNSLALDSTLGFATNDGMAVSSNPDGSLNQLPVIALICDFPAPASTTTPPLLPMSHLTTLFHEMGHAIHSALGRTKLQNVAGTRCATDFAELPSVLMERFATHPDVLALYARHWQTDEPLSPETAWQLHSASQHRSPAARAADIADTAVQVRLALIDQAFHSPQVNDATAWNTDTIMHEIDGTYAIVSEPRDTRWQGFFGHLVGYGGSYYAYLFDRAIASRIWDVVFLRGDSAQGSPVRREAGELFREEVLRWGGSRDGWACVAGVLGDDSADIAEGGETAMTKVGQWGINTA